MGSSMSKQRHSTANSNDNSQHSSSCTPSSYSQQNNHDNQNPTTSAAITDPDSQPSMDQDNSSRPPSTQTSASAPTDSDRPSSQSDKQVAASTERIETPGTKQVEVLSINNPEDYEDNTNQTGLSHYEMKIMDKFYSAPERPRSKAYKDAKQAANQKRLNRKSKDKDKDSTTSSSSTSTTSKRKFFKKSSNNKNNQNDTNEPNTIGYAMENTKKLGILSLSNFNLTTIPDQVFESLPGTCRTINISFNNLTSLDIRFFDYVLVNRLTANGNLLQSIPSTISRMTALKKLDLANNKLTHLPNSFNSMKHLEYVDVSQNQLTALPSSFTSLNLTALKLSHNQFKSLPLQIACMDLLMELDVSYNFIHNIPIQFTALEQLISFNLEHNQILDFPNQILVACTSLVTLKLHSNPITMAMLQEKPAFEEFQQRQRLKLKRQLDAGSISEADLNPTDS